MTVGLCFGSNCCFFSLTCSHSLPADGEGGPGLDHVHGNGTVIVCSGAPGKLHGGVGDVAHGQALRGAGGSCNSTKRGAAPASAPPRQQQPNQKALTAPPTGDATGAIGSVRLMDWLRLDRPLYQYKNKHQKLWKKLCSCFTCAFIHKEAEKKSPHPG